MPSASIGTKAPVALALWVGVVSQFLPVVGTYLAAALPLVVALIDSPTKALVLLVFVLIYQQVENYVLLPRITARTMDLHPAIAFGAAIAGLDFTVIEAVKYHADNGAPVM